MVADKRREGCGSPPRARSTSWSLLVVSSPLAASTPAAPPEFRHRQARIEETPAPANWAAARRSEAASCLRSNSSIASAIELRRRRAPVQERLHPGEVEQRPAVEAEAVGRRGERDGLLRELPARRRRRRGGRAPWRAPSARAAASRRRPRLRARRSCSANCSASSLAPLLVQHLRQHRRHRRAHLGLADLLELLVPPAQLLLGGGEVAGHHLDAGGVDGPCRERERHPELLEDRAAATRGSREPEPGRRPSRAGSRACRGSTPRPSGPRGPAPASRGSGRSPR